MKPLVGNKIFHHLIAIEFNRDLVKSRQKLCIIDIFQKMF